MSSLEDSEHERVMGQNAVEERMAQRLALTA
jgi:hypothetical protein